MDKKLSKTAYGGIAGKDYVPYIADGDHRGSNLVILIAGIVLAILFAASTAYSGMKSGLTVAAGIPGSILGSAIVASLAKKKGILGKNLLQGMSSGGESIASGTIFVLPAVLLIGAQLSFWEASLVGIAGAIFGIGISTLVHDYLLIEEHGNLKYPESMAISETLVASEGSSEGLKFMGIGFGIGGIITLFTGSFLGVVNNMISFVQEKGFRWRFQTEVSPMLMGIGYIVGLQVSLLMFAGSIFANFAVLPIIGYFCDMAGSNAHLWNDAATAVTAASVGQIGNSYLRYMGAGMMLSGGLIGAVKLIPIIVSSIKATLGKISGKDESPIGKIALIVGTLLSIVMAFVLSGGNILMAILGGLVSMILAMLFVIVSGRLTGTIGTSNLPVSGMTIASLVVVALLFVSMGWNNAVDTKILLLFATFIVTAIAIGGGYTQSQKVGFVIGGRKDEMTKHLCIASVVGVLTVVGVIILLAPKLTAGNEFQIPQANLMSALTKGIFSGDLPWTIVIAGAVMGIFFYLAKLPVMTVAIGFYLSISTTSIILIGSLIRWVVELVNKNAEVREKKLANGTSLSAGLVAGSSIIGLIGIFLQVFKVIVPGELKGFVAGNGMALILLALLIAAVGISVHFAGGKNHGKA